LRNKDVSETNNHCFRTISFSHETGDKLIMVFLKNTNEIQGMKFYAHCCSNKDAKINLIKSKQGCTHVKKWSPDQRLEISKTLNLRIK
jgi:hypothetical protein